MKRSIVLLVIIQISLVQYGQIIANHTIVDRFDDIPQQYIDAVKKMWLTVPGESHSEAYRVGLAQLESLFPAYAVSVVESGAPEAYTTSNLRASKATWGSGAYADGWRYSYGEADWWTRQISIDRTTAGIAYCHSHDLTIAAIGFGWCWDMIRSSDSGLGAPTVAADPVTGNRWWGLSDGTPSPTQQFGLNTADFTETQNAVSMDTYLRATQAISDFCTANNIPTKVFFTTGPVDTYFTGESGYQGHLKHEYIRSYIAANNTTILFDYADILCYDDAGNLSTTSWNGNTYPTIHPNNLIGDYTTSGHIGSNGAIRLAKAMWWMLARIAGWDGITTNVKINELPDPISVIIDNESDEIRVQTSEKYLSGQISIYSMQGYLIQKKRINSTLCLISTSSMLSGVYLLNVNKSSLTETRKIVVLN